MVWPRLLGCATHRGYPRVISKIRSESVTGVLGIPFWPSAGFWPLLRSGGGWASFVKDAKVFSDSCDNRIVFPGPHPVGVMGSDSFHTRMIFLWWIPDSYVSGIFCVSVSGGSVPFLHVNPTPRFRSGGPCRVRSSPGWDLSRFGTRCLKAYTEGSVWGSGLGPEPLSLGSAPCWYEVPKILL